MKSLIQAVAIAAVLAVPAVSFAQENPDSPVTRSAVNADLAQLQRVGYQPSADDNAYYPAGIQAAEARVDAANGSSSAYGGVAGASSESGVRGGTGNVSAADWNAMYSH
ncbi:hypothetical protein CY652_15260 [Burkholderia sp. WAC0059]|uniref:DUF4148 domain-containing protein n=1 Tax=Burkholderia sp. WAC0059 TaxID=2066022 RepID=UPI000C7EEA68|nr:DUF4148 domain-containing protein [Burkholderia sp. WAC0059]PLZ01474.1 hypothetical protein CY652_15260 [Burkholderia sp. WAC0059]